jgi:hypothetical protein
MSEVSDTITTTNERENLMNLEEFIAYVEMRQKISLEEALAKLTTRKEN